MDMGATQASVMRISLSFFGNNCTDQSFKQAIGQEELAEVKNILGVGRHFERVFFGGVAK